MRILQLHCDYVEYTPVKKEISLAEPLENTGTSRFEELVVAFVTLEKGDDDKTISNATSQILESLGKIKCCKVLLYPYSHLGLLGILTYDFNMRPPLSHIQNPDWIFDKSHRSHGTYTIKREHAVGPAEYGRGTTRLMMQALVI